MQEGSGASISVVGSLMFERSVSGMTARTLNFHCMQLMRGMPALLLACTIGYLLVIMLLEQSPCPNTRNLLENVSENHGDSPL